MQLLAQNILYPVDSSKARGPTYRQRRPNQFDGESSHTSLDGLKIILELYHKS